jgi:apolipoprotein N-acyltransferase
MSPAWTSFFLPHRDPAVPWFVRCIIAVLSGVILSLSFRGTFPSFYSWFCIALLLSSVLNARPWVAFLCGFLHAIFFVVTAVPWIAETLSIHGGMSMAAGWGVLLLIASVWGAAVGTATLCFWRISRRSISLALFAAPFLWIATECFRTYLPEISFPWALLGYPAAENPAIAQFIPITGIYGISFLVAAYNSLLLWLDTPAPFSSPARIRRVAIVAAAFVALLAVQWFGPSLVPKAEAHHIARAVQPNFPENQQYVGDWYADHQADMAELNRLSLEPAGTNRTPDLLLWPEAPAPFSFQDARFGPYIAHLSQQIHQPMIAGIIEWKANPDTAHITPRTAVVPFNSAAMIDENGHRVFAYDKIHLVPFGEYEPFPLIHTVVNSVSEEVGGFHKGTTRSVGKFSNGNTFAVFICYEAIYGGEIRQFVNRGAELLINISNDGWFGTSAAAEQHLRMARIRAIENRRWLLRDTNSGITASIDPYGNTIRVMRRDQRAAADLPYDFRTEKTLYTRLGDWFVWMCLAVSAILVLLTFRKVK